MEYVYACVRVHELQQSCFHLASSSKLWRPLLHLYPGKATCCKNKVKLSPVPAPPRPSALAHFCSAAQHWKFVGLAKETYAEAGELADMSQRLEASIQLQAVKAQAVQSRQGGKNLHARLAQVHPLHLQGGTAR